MEIYDLDFNTVITNVEEDVTRFFCPIDSKLIHDIRKKFNISLSKRDSVDGYAAECTGMIHHTNPILKLPTVMVEEFGAYYDTSILLFGERELALVIIERYESKDEPIAVHQDYDPYKLYYEYVGSITNLRVRVQFERAFMNSVNEKMKHAEQDKAFRSVVEEEIISKMFK